MIFNPFPKRQISNFSALREFADDNFKLDENGGKFSKRVENTVGKGEIACNKQFLLFPTVFSKDLYCRHVKTRAYLEKGKAYSFGQELMERMHVAKKHGKKDYQHFLLFLQCFQKPFSMQ